MNILIDTHIFIWAVASPKLLSDPAAAYLTDVQNRIYLSAVSIWEIALKYPRRTKTAPPFSAAAATMFAEQLGVSVVNITAEHCARVELLPEVHSDPFDRLLIAQAGIEQLKFMTHDRRLQGYGDHILFV